MGGLGSACVCDRKNQRHQKWRLGSTGGNFCNNTQNYIGKCVVTVVTLIVTHTYTFSCPLWPLSGLLGFFLCVNHVTYNEMYNVLKEILNAQKVSVQNRTVILSR